MQLNKQLNKTFKGASRETEVASVENKDSPHCLFPRETQIAVPLRSRKELFVFVHTGEKERLLGAPETKQETLLLHEFLKD